jgi:hypothetical protein
MDLAGKNLAEYSNEIILKMPYNRTNDLETKKEIVMEILKCTARAIEQFHKRNNFLKSFNFINMFNYIRLFLMFSHLL